MGGISSRENLDLNEEDQQIEASPKTIQCSILGRVRVGKTYILNHLTSGPISPHYISTIGLETRDLFIDNCHIQLWDTSGLDDGMLAVNERLPTIHQYAVSKSQVVILVHASDNRRSWFTISRIYDSIRRDLPIETKIIIATVFQSEEHCISASEMEQLIYTIKDDCHPLLMLSIPYGPSSHSCFDEIVEFILE